jgi:hypothetical protein
VPAVPEKPKPSRWAYCHHCQGMGLLRHVYGTVYRCPMYYHEVDLGVERTARDDRKSEWRSPSYFKKPGRD